MEDINNYIKENDTDNRIIKNLNDLIDTILYNDDEYVNVVDEYTSGKTIVECLAKLEDVLFDYTMDKIYSSVGGNYATMTELQVTLSDNSTNKIRMHKSGKMRYIEGYFEITFTNLTKDSLGFFKIGSMKDGLFHRFTCFIKDSSNNINAGMIRFDNDIKLYLNNDITELNGKYTIEYFGSWMEPYQD